MQTIWKYDLEILDSQTVLLPRGAKLLSVGVQSRPSKSHQLCLWALVDPNESTVPRTIAIYGTGNPIKGDPGKCIGTVSMAPFVWHVFEAEVQHG